MGFLPAGAPVLVEEGEGTLREREYRGKPRCSVGTGCCLLPGGRGCRGCTSVKCPALPSSRLPSIPKRLLELQPSQHSEQQKGGIGWGEGQGHCVKSLTYRLRLRDVGQERSHGRAPGCKDTCAVRC